MEEDKIIKDTLRKNSKRDIINYCLIGFVFLMIFVPAIFKVVFYDSSIKITTKDVVYLTLTCRKSSIVGGSNISTLIVNKYKDSLVQSSTVTYGYSKDNIENVPDVEMILSLNLGNKIEQKENDNGYTFTFDFVKNKDLLRIDDLKKFSMSAPSATKEYAEQGYFCERYSEVITEEIDEDEEKEEENDLNDSLTNDNKSNEENTKVVKDENDEKDTKEVKDASNGEKDADLTTSSLSCRKSVATYEEEKTTIIENKYKNNNIQNSTVTYVYDKENEEDFDSLKILLSLGDKIEKKENDNGYTFTIDFEKNEDLLLIADLKMFSMSKSDAYEEYKNAGFFCEEDSVNGDENENQ